MGDILVGDQLFGFPIVEIANNKITIMPLPGTPVSFDADQFNAGLLATLEALGSFVPGPR